MMIMDWEEAAVSISQDLFTEGAFFTATHALNSSSSSSRTQWYAISTTPTATPEDPTALDSSCTGNTQSHLLVPEGAIWLNSNNSTHSWAQWMPSCSPTDLEGSSSYTGNTTIAGALQLLRGCSSSSSGGSRDGCTNSRHVGSLDSPVAARMCSRIPHSLAAAAALAAPEAPEAPAVAGLVGNLPVCPNAPVRVPPPVTLVPATELALFTH